MERLTGNDNNFFQDGMDEHKVSAVYFKLKAYEDAEEQGLLVRPGDKVWLSIQSYQEICEATVIKVELNYYTNPALWVTIEYQSKIIGKQEYKNRWDLMFDKTVFLTRQEAEKALREANRNG